MKRKIIGIALLLTIGTSAQAQQYNFTLDGNGFANASVLEGVIDIATDTLTVTSWIDLPGDAVSGFNFWTAPAGTVFYAQKVLGAPTGAQTDAYDITSINPTNFSFDNGAYVFRLPGNDNVAWNEGSYPFTSGGFIKSDGSTDANINIIPVNNNQNGAWGGTMTVTPVPEPSSAVFGVLVGALILLQRKRR